MDCVQHLSANEIVLKIIVVPGNIRQRSLLGWLMLRNTAIPHRRLCSAIDRWVEPIEQENETYTDSQNSQPRSSLRLNCRLDCKTGLYNIYLSPQNECNGFSSFELTKFVCKAVAAKLAKAVFLWAGMFIVYRLLCNKTSTPALVTMSPKRAIGSATSMYRSRPFRPYWVFLVAKVPEQYW